MPIDPRIPLSALGGSPRQQLDVAGTIYRAQAAHAMQAEAQKKQLEAQKQQQIDALASQYDDPEEYIQAVSRIDPLAARKFGEQFEKHKNEQLEGHKRKLEVDGKKLDYYMRILPDDPDEYAIWRQSIVSKSPEFDFLPQPEQWAADPEVRQRVKMMGLTAAEQNKAEQEATRFLLEGKPHEGLARVLKDAPTLDVARNYLTETKGIVPKAVRQFYEGIIASSPSWEVARQRIGEAGLSSKETADVQAKVVDDTRLDAQFQELVRHNKATEANVARTRAEAERHNRQMENKPTASAEEVGGLVDTVVNNPMLWDELTPTVKGKIAGALAARGFEGFGKPMSNAAIKQVAESKSAIDNLRDLRVTLQQNEQFIGPLAGLQALNPYSDARKAQAKIDTVRQRVGKALEGGVLRKEDEEKYKKILSTLSDTPETAIFKVDNLIATIENDIKRYTAEQRLAGRRVNQEAPETPRTATEQSVAPSPKDGDKKPIPGFPGTEQTYKNGKWIRTK